ncbi:hypothetical protein HH310_07465 [Actinoplanes sp. TBRC 11911]|uniref:hypothetical protein n=1 Tax=Actinoplanes sp. TBRC 11911 TaxID=2729386 RepID=UPI00145CDCD0|nr:hypothetical protein [Actinoplanes sp. TBRC 11911]NMO51027.1 hypothetical protein [Actinoplanes sp. TBRC 11911]
MTATKEVQWSELQRDPKSVAALADNGDVRVRRRDGAALLLMREDRVNAAGEGAFTAARALRNVLTHLPLEAAAAALTEEFPWLTLLPVEELPQFIADFTRAAQIAAEVGQWSVLTQAVREWKATAAVYADPALLRRLTEPLTDDFGPVPAPVDVDGDAG